MIQSFANSYSQLNERQKLAVDTLDGPVIVMAGPGTGKTQILTLRIANILQKTDTDPGAILALTFTEAAAKEMRSRLINLLGKPGFSVRVSTFHSFCADIIAENPQKFSRPAGSQAVTELERIKIITEILENNSFLSLKPPANPTFYLRYIISAISDLKREAVNLSKFTQIIKDLSSEFESEKDSLKKTAFNEKEKLVSKNLDLLKIYGLYQQALDQLGRFDFEDMINWVIDAFDSDPDFLLEYQEKYQYFLVDEYQDTNSAQNKLIFALTSFWGQNANLFVVGDPNQSIYRFQGASQENVHQFNFIFPNATQIVLTHNYRSTKSILESAASLIGSESLVDNSPHPPLKVNVVEASSQALEDEYLIRTIRSMLDEGIDSSSLAIIVKENREVAHLAQLLSDDGIPYRFEGGVNVLTTPLVAQFLKILRVVTTLHANLDDLDLFTILNFPYFKLDPVEVLKLSRSSHFSKQSLFQSLQQSPLADHQKIATLLVNWNQQATQIALPEIFQQILQQSGLLDYLLSLPDSLSQLNRFGTLFQDLKSQLQANLSLDLFSYVKNLLTMEEHGLALLENKIVGVEKGVTLTTAHKSKGLEWGTVFVYRFADTHWGNKSSRQMIKLPPTLLKTRPDLEDKNSEERRLFYVALTRAKQQLYLTGSTSYNSSAKMVFPSIFLTDLPQGLLTNTDTSSLEQDVPQILTKILSPAHPQTTYDHEIEYLDRLIADFKLSPTALNTYLQCRYKFKLDNLYKIPRAKAPVMCFGTAIHYALEHLYRRLEKKSAVEDKSLLYADFQKALDMEFLTKAQRQDLLLHGHKVLSNYYEQYKEDFKQALFTEKNFGTSTPVFLGDIALSGKADRIDLLDQTKKHVRFVDYKTGVPKTRGVLEKEGDGVEGNYKRQLTFYHLLAKLDKSFPYKVTETQIDFVEADKTGKFHRESFFITPEEVAQLTQTIKREVSQIRQHNFERTADTSICARCDFKSHCWPDGIPEETI